MFYISLFQIEPAVTIVRHNFENNITVYECHEMLTKDRVKSAKQC